MVLDLRVVNQRINGSPIEPRSGLAYWETHPDGDRLVHYSACQGAHPTRDILAKLYDLPTDRVRAVVPDVGGGFGVKSRTIGEELTLGWLSKQVGKPVRYTETRTEAMQAMPQGRGQRVDVKIGGTRDGRITAYQLDVVQDAGAYPLMGAYLPMMTQRMAPGVYDIPNCGFRGVSVATNKMSVTAYRGAGRPEAALAIERAVDYFAAEIGMDPAEVRRRNFIPQFLEPYTTGIGTVYDVGDYDEAMRRVLDAADYTGAARSTGRAAGEWIDGADRHRPGRLRRDHVGRRADRVRRSAAVGGRPAARVDRRDAVRAGTRHDVEDDHRRPPRRADGRGRRRPR